MVLELATVCTTQAASLISVQVVQLQVDSEGPGPSCTSVSEREADTLYVSKKRIDWQLNKKKCKFLIMVRDGHFAWDKVDRETTKVTSRRQQTKAEERDSLKINT